MARTKELSPKKSKIATRIGNRDTKEKKIEKPIPIDDPELILPVADKVADEEENPESEEGELAGEETGLDSDEVDPFGDKWEE